MHMYFRGEQSKLRKAVSAVASDTQAAFTSVLAACLPACLSAAELAPLVNCE